MARTPDFPKNRSIGDLFAEIRRPKPGPDTSWYKAGPSEPHGIDLENGWINSTLSTGVPPVSWYLSEDGELRMRGRIAGGTTGTVALTLPEELRPEFSQYFSIETDIDGEMTLDGIRFRTFYDSDTLASEDV